jgi:hypothetical protein
METKAKNPVKEPPSGAPALAVKTPAPAPAVATVPEQAVVETIARERNALPGEARQYLDAHLLANKSRALNEQCFTQVHTFKPLTLTFNALRANSKAFLTLRPDELAIWSDGGKGNRLIGLAVSSRLDPVLYVSNFLINAREMYLQTYQDAQEIQIDLYVRTTQPGIRGNVDLPPGASVTLRSTCDRSTVIGVSSFAIELSEH